jgi:hypothetical protein
MVESTVTLPSGYCCGFDEWYIFQGQPPQLGSLCHTNIFESKIAPGTVFQFINFDSFRFSDPQMNAISDLFWEQMHWIQPESYVADSEDCLLFATRDPRLYETVQQIIAKLPSTRPCS